MALIPPDGEMLGHSIASPLSAKKLGCALFGKRPAACKIIDFDPLRFSIYGLPTTFSRFRAFGALCPSGRYFRLRSESFTPPSLLLLPKKSRLAGILQNSLDYQNHRF